MIHKRKREIRKYNLMVLEKAIKYTANVLQFGYGPNTTFEGQKEKQKNSVLHTQGPHTISQRLRHSPRVKHKRLLKI